MIINNFLIPLTKVIGLKYDLSNTDFKTNCITMKTIKFLLALVISFSLVYCSDSDSGDTSPQNPDTESADASDNSSNPITTNENEGENPTISNNTEIVTFTKANNTDPKLEANQDRITDKVWITRGNKGEIYNIAVEESLTKNTSPIGTEWAIGTTENLSTLTFNSFRITLNSEIKDVVDKDLVLHLIEDDLYFDVKFSQWTSGGGGSFSYTRTLFKTPSTEAKQQK